MKTKYLSLVTLVISSAAFAGGFRCEVDNYGRSLTIESPTDIVSSTPQITYVVGEGFETVVGTQSFMQHYLRLGCVQAWHAEATFAYVGLQLEAHTQSFSNEECGGGMPPQFQAQLTQTFLDGHSEQSTVSCHAI